MVGLLAAEAEAIPSPSTASAIAVNMLLLKAKRLETDPHLWFAWFPVLTPEGLVWLELVRREWTDPGMWYACYEHRRIPQRST